jgi:hypothetical protein
VKPTDLRGILQYIPRFREKVFVISVDGAIVTDENFANILLDIAVLRSLNIRVVLVHGAAAEIRRLATAQKITPSNLDGSGITAPDTLRLALAAANHLTHEILEGFSTNDLRAACTNSITDGSASAVYRVASDTDSLELFVQPEDMPSPNGITMSDDGGHLFVALRGDIGKVSVATRSLSMVARPEGISVGADGLYFRNRSLITVWPGKERHGVTRYTMNAALDTIETIEPVIQEHASFAQPTTGVIVGADIYVVANSQLQVFSRLYAAGGAIDTGVLEVPAILRVSLAR